MPFVLDCSVALAWVMPDEDDERADAYLERLLVDRALVPQLWSLEVANVLLISGRCGRINDDEIENAINNLRSLPIDVDQKTHEYAFAETFVYAAEHGLTVYDAAYLELAKRRDLPIATFDIGLSKQPFQGDYACGFSPARSLAVETCG
jgi:predicted nucleic acid-binding protein